MGLNSIQIYRFLWARLGKPLNRFNRLLTRAVRLRTEPIEYRLLTRLNCV
jgi:hypothetical protein